MKISVVTVCFNSAKTIADTLQSVCQQTYQDFEHIVVDGGSKDGTQAIVLAKGIPDTKFISEPDQGIYYAMNKGIAMATGDVVGFINADDFYASSDILDLVAKVFEDLSIDACYGDLCYVNAEKVDEIVRYWRSTPFQAGLFSQGWCPPHPTFFVRRGVYERFGRFDLSYKIAADVELMMRFLEVHHVRSKHIPRILVKMRMGGTTNKSLKNIVKQNGEILRALRLHRLSANPVPFFGRKFISRGMQFIAKPRLGSR